MFPYPWSLSSGVVLLVRPDSPWRDAFPVAAMAFPTSHKNVRILGDHRDPSWRVNMHAILKRAQNSTEKDLEMSLKDLPRHFDIVGPVDLETMDFHVDPTAMTVFRSADFKEDLYTFLWFRLDSPSRTWEKQFSAPSFRNAIMAMEQHVENVEKGRPIAVDHVVTRGTPPEERSLSLLRWRSSTLRVMVGDQCILPGDMEFPPLNPAFFSDF
jgi:hypothetical protein